MDGPFAEDFYMDVYTHTSLLKYDTRIHPLSGRCFRFLFCRVQYFEAQAYFNFQLTHSKEH